MAGLPATTRISGGRHSPAAREGRQLVVLGQLVLEQLVLEHVVLPHVALGQVV